MLTVSSASSPIILCKPRIAVAHDPDVVRPQDIADLVTCVSFTFARKYSRSVVLDGHESGVRETSIAPFVLRRLVLACQPDLNSHLTQDQSGKLPCIRLSLAVKSRLLKLAAFLEEGLSLSTLHQMEYSRTFSCETRLSSTSSQDCVCACTIFSTSANREYPTFD